MSHKLTNGMKMWKGNGNTNTLFSLNGILTGTPRGKRHLGRPRCRWEDNIRMYIKEIGINTMNWVESAQNRDYWRDLVNAALNLRAQ